MFSSSSRLSCCKIFVCCRWLLKNKRVLSALSPGNQDGTPYSSNLLLGVQDRFVSSMLGKMEEHSGFLTVGEMLHCVSRGLEPGKQRRQQGHGTVPLQGPQGAVVSLNYKEMR